MHRTETLLEAVLERELGRTRAPDELWDRIQNRTARTQARMPVLQLLAAAALIAVVMWGMYPRALAIQSGDSANIREWVKAKAGLDVPLLATLPSSIRLAGARIAGGKAEISCRVGNRDVKLVVAKAQSAGSNIHADSRDRRTVSWTLRGQSYMLSCGSPEDLKIACLLCHAGGA